MSRRVLITGGAGFAGSHLIEHLLVTTDWDLSVVDSLTYAGRVDRLTDCEGYDPDRVDLFWHDLRAPIHEHVDDRIGPVDAVLHLAAESHVDRSIADPGPFVLNNITGTLNLLEWARTRPELTHFVQVSTDEVYGPAPEGYAHQEWDTPIPSNPYAASKAAQEALAVAWWRTFNVPVVITNTMNMFGERQHAEKFVPMVIRRVLSDRTVPIHARPAQPPGLAVPVNVWEPSARHWLHARNHADALRWIVQQTHPQRYGQRPGGERPDRWHVAGPERDVLQMARHIAEVLDRPLQFQMVDYHRSRPGHDHRYALNADKIAEHGWKPPVDMDESLERTVRWFAAHRDWLVY